MQEPQNGNNRTVSYQCVPEAAQRAIQKITTQGLKPQLNNPVHIGRYAFFLIGSDIACMTYQAYVDDTMGNSSKSKSVLSSLQQALDEDTRFIEKDSKKIHDHEVILVNGILFIWRDHN